MDDLISRYEAIDVVEKSKRLNPHQDSKMASAHELEHRHFLKILFDLPPAESQWILFSEELPEEHEWVGTKEFGTTISDEVYVTFEGPTGERFCKHVSFQNGKLSSYTQREIDVWYKGSVPIAWKPLPEPYKGKKE